MIDTYKVMTTALVPCRVCFGFTVTEAAIAFKNFMVEFSVQPHRYIIVLDPITYHLHDEGCTTQQYCYSSGGLRKSKFQVEKCRIPQVTMEDYQIA
jgi:hypothetical protein